MQTESNLLVSDKARGKSSTEDYIVIIETGELPKVARGIESG